MSQSTATELPQHLLTWTTKNRNPNCVYLTVYLQAVVKETIKIPDPVKAGTQNY